MYFLINIFGNNVLSWLIIFKIITKNGKISLKLPIKGKHPTTGWPIHLKISGQIYLNLINNFNRCQNYSKCFDFIHGGHLVWLAWSTDTFLKLHTLMMIVAKFDLIWPSSFRGKDFCNS